GYRGTIPAGMGLLPRLLGTGGAYRFHFGSPRRSPAARAIITAPPAVSTRNAAAGQPEASQAAPPTSGPTKEVVYMIRKMPALKRGTSSVSASSGGRARVSTSARAAA